MSRIVFYSCSIESHAPWRPRAMERPIVDIEHISRDPAPKNPAPPLGRLDQIYAWKREKSPLGIFLTVAQMQQLKGNWLI